MVGILLLLGRPIFREGIHPELHRKCANVLMYIQSPWWQVPQEGFHFPWQEVCPRWVVTGRAVFSHWKETRWPFQAHDGDKNGWWILMIVTMNNHKFQCKIIWHILLCITMCLYIYICMHKVSPDLKFPKIRRFPSLSYLVVGEFVWR